MGGRDGNSWRLSVSEGIGDSPVKQKGRNGQKTFLIKRREKMVSLVIIKEGEILNWVEANFCF